MKKNIDRIVINLRTKEVMPKAVIDLNNHQFSSLASLWDLQLNRVPDSKVEEFDMLAEEIYKKVCNASPCESCWSGYTQLDLIKRQLRFL